MDVNKNNGPGRGMYNNEVTYDKKWETKKNRHYRDMAMDIAKKSECMSSIPLSWAREVYFFLRHLEHTYGIKYPTRTHMGYYLPSIPKTLRIMFIDPITRLPKTLKKLYKDVFSEPSKFQKKYAPTRKDRVKETLFGFCGRGGYLYGWQLAWHRLYGFAYNKIKRPKIGLGQFKEKFGYVTVYYDAPDDISKEVDRYIKRLELSLARKGAYYDVTKGKK